MIIKWQEECWEVKYYGTGYPRYSLERDGIAVSWLLNDENNFSNMNEFRKFLRKLKMSSLDREENKLSNLHWIDKNYRQRMLRKDVQKILLEREHINSKGNICKLKVKHIGAGVYEIYKEVRNL